ncbi:MAG: hypothetical protein ACK5L5_07125 [Bacteroidales bacterium]
MEQKVHVQFGSPSFGVTLFRKGKLLPYPFKPYEFEIGKAYVFGSVKYNGKWTGVRMTID